MAGGLWSFFVSAAFVMRYAGHLGLRAPDRPLFRHSARSADPVDQIAFLAEQGFAGVQDNFLKLRPVDEQQRIGAAIARHGLRMGSFNNNPLAWNRPLWSATDPDARAELARDLEESITAAARTGGQHLTCVTGMGPRDGQAAQDAARHAAELQGMIANLRRLADRAAAGNCILCVEPVAAAWIPGLLVATLADALHVVRAVAHPAVKLLFDIAHVQTSEGDVLARLGACWNEVALLQAADTPGRCDLGSGELDWPAILRFVRAQRYDGLIEIEHLPLDDSAAGEAQLLHRLHAVDAAI